MRSDLEMVLVPLNGQSFLLCQLEFAFPKTTLAAMIEMAAFHTRKVQHVRCDHHADPPAAKTGREQEFAVAVVVQL